MRTYGPKNIIRIEHSLKKKNNKIFNAVSYGPDTNLPRLKTKKLRRYYYDYRNNVLTFNKITNAVLNRNIINLNDLNLKSSIYCIDSLNENPHSDIYFKISSMFDINNLPNNSQIFIEIAFLEYTDLKQGPNAPTIIKPLYQYRIYRYGVIINDTVVLFRNNRRRI